MSSTLNRTLAFLVRWALTLIVAFVILFPLYWIFISSITPKNQLFASPINYWPSAATLENYFYLFNRLDIMTKINNTLLITVFALVISTVLCMAAAYAFSRFNSRGLTIAFSALVFSALIPGIVTARPLYDFMRMVDLVDTFPGLIVLYTSALIPFTMLILYNFIREVPLSIDEAAEVDGANFLQKMIHVTFPLMRPAIATVSIINFITCLNDLFTPLFYARKIEVLSVAITTIPRESSYQLPWDKISTMGWIIVFPIILFVLIFQKNIMEGIMAGGVKQ